MKVIDLLNKIANEESVPHKIKYNGYTYKKCVGNKTYWTGDKPSNTLMIDTYDLNKEVEIIEEDKEIEEIKQMYEDRDMYDFTFWESEFQTCTDLEKKIIDNIGLLRRKQEELIKAVNELKKGK